MLVATMVLDVYDKNRVHHSVSENPMTVEEELAQSRRDMAETEARTNKRLNEHAVAIAQIDAAERRQTEIIAAKRAAMNTRKIVGVMMTRAQKAKVARESDKAKRDAARASRTTVRKLIIVNLHNKFPLGVLRRHK